MFQSPVNTVMNLQLP